MDEAALLGIASAMFLRLLAILLAFVLEPVALVVLAAPPSGNSCQIGDGTPGGSLGERAGSGHIPVARAS